MFTDEPLKRKNEFMDGPCSVCGSADFEWGTLYQARHRPSRPIWGYGQVITTRRCRTCDNILLFVDEEATRKQNQYIWLIVAVAILVPLLILFVTFTLIGIP